MFFTHLNPDHVGWNLTPGTSGAVATFPKAKYVAHQDDGDTFRKPEVQEGVRLETELASLVIPDVDAAKEAGKLLEELPTLWEEADLSERRKILVTMMEAIYVDTVEERAIVALKPKPAFRALFQVATTREGSGVVLYKENPPDLLTSPEDDVFLVETGESGTRPNSISGKHWLTA